MHVGPSIMAVLDDTFGNLIQHIENTANRG